MVRIWTKYGPRRMRMAAKKVKITVNINEDELSDLRRQAEKDGITVTDALRRSIAVGRIAAQAKNRGQKILVEDGQGDLRQIEIV
jgi:hypothetical protein